MKQFDETQMPAVQGVFQKNAVQNAVYKITGSGTMVAARAREVAVVGGDGRQIAVAEALTSLFPEVRIYGPPQAVIPEGLLPSESLNEAIKGAKIIVLPISGMNDAGLVRGYRVDQMIDFGNWLEILPEGTLIVAGSLTAKWLRKMDALHLQAMQYAEDDELAILNSIPTAEGAVQIAMEELPITIHGSTVAVIGFGRVGLTVARLFKALGARVLVVARRPAVLARAYEMGCEMLHWDSLAAHAGSADIIINTIPAPVVTANVLARVKPEVLIIDLASAPGGTDFEVAKKLNIKAKLALGLPGKVAPQTAGAILARIIPNLICRFLTNSEAKQSAAKSAATVANTETDAGAEKKNESGGGR